MEITSAIRLIDHLVYKPRWHFEAEDHSNRFEGCVRIKVHYPAFNSNRDQIDLTEPSQSYPEEIMTYATFPLLVGDCDDDMMLYRRLINFIIKIEEHETREFLRVQPTGWAPFHPHKIRGMKAWHQTSRTCNDETALVGDLQFGVA